MALILIPSSKNSTLAMTAAEYNSQINQLNTQKDAANNNLGIKKLEDQTLSGEVARFDAQIGTIQAQINNTQAQIDTIGTQIEDANTKIAQAESDIKIKRESLNEYLRVLYEDSNTSTIELVASSNSFSDFIDKTEYNLTMQEKIQDTVHAIKSLKKELENKKSQLVEQNKQIENLKSQQVAQRQGLDGQRSAKNNLLASTRGQESNYKAQLASIQKQMDAARATYEATIRSSQSSGGSTYSGGGNSGNSSGGGNAGTAYLSWPESGWVTQGYGCTDFAECGNPKGPYGGKPHNGIDISLGYPGAIKAAADGVVLDTGSEYNSGGWGNWVAIRHTGSLNGLVSFYGHLSSIAVSPGQSVSRGQQIGTEGATGFAFGSHLHFSVWTNFVLYNTPGYHGPLYEGTVNPYSFLK